MPKPILSVGAALSYALADGSCPASASLNAWCMSTHSGHLSLLPFSAGASPQGTPHWSAAQYTPARLMANSSGSLPVDNQQTDTSTNQTAADPPPSPTDQELEQAAQEAEYRTLEVLLGSATAPEAEEYDATAATCEAPAATSKPTPDVSGRRCSRSRSRARAVAKRLLHRTSKSTCRSPSGAFRGDRIHSSIPSPTDGLAPNLPSSALLYQGAARTHDVPAERWLRFSKCVADFPTSLRQIECNASSTWVRCLPCDPRPRTSLAAAFHAPPLPYLRSCTLSCNRSPALQCSLWPRRYPAQNTAHNLVPPPLAGVGMASRKERRQDRQSHRPGSLNRRFTDAPSVDAAVTAPAANSTPAADACSAPSVEPCRLTLKEVALLNYVSWKGRTGKPPPLTVYAEPSLQHVLRGLRQKQRQPLTTPEDEVQVVADLIHVPDVAQTYDTQDSSAKLRPKPKTKHGSITVAPPEFSQSSRTLQPTAISSDSSSEKTSRVCRKTQVHARRQPKKRPRSRKDVSKVAASRAAPPPSSADASARQTAITSSASTLQASCGAESGQHPRPSQTAASPSLPPLAAEDTEFADTAQPRDQRSRTSSPVPNTDPEYPIRDNEPQEKRTSDKDSNPKAKTKRKRAAGTKKSKGPKQSHRAGSTRSSIATTSSSKRTAASSTEIMDPDFRPDPAKRPRIVSPWLEPMSKATERYMSLCTLHSMQSRCSSQRHPLPQQQTCPRCASVLSPLPRLSSQHTLLPPSARTSTLTLCSPVPPVRRLFQPCYYTQVCVSSTASLRMINRHEPHSLCLGKHLRATRFRQAIPRRRRRFRTVHISHRSGPQPAWLLTVSQKLMAALSLSGTHCVHLNLRQPRRPFMPYRLRSKILRIKRTTALLPDALLFPVPSPGVIRKQDTHQRLPPTFYFYVCRSFEEPQSGLLSRGLEALSTDILLKPYTGTPSMQPLRRSRSVSLSTRPLTSKQSASAPYSGLLGVSIVLVTPHTVAIVSLSRSLMPHLIHLPGALATTRTAVHGRASTSCRGTQAGYPAIAINSYCYGFRAQANIFMLLPYRRPTGATMPATRYKAGTPIIFPALRVTNPLGSSSW